MWQSSKWTLPDWWVLVHKHLDSFLILRVHLNYRPKLHVFTLPFCTQRWPLFIRIRILRPRTCRDIYMYTVVCMCVNDSKGNRI